MNVNDYKIPKDYTPSSKPSKPTGPKPKKNIGISATDLTKSDTLNDITSKGEAILNETSTKPAKEKIVAKKILKKSKPQITPKLNFNKQLTSIRQDLDIYKHNEKSKLVEYLRCLDQDYNLSKYLGGFTKYEFPDEEHMKLLEVGQQDNLKKEMRIQEENIQNFLESLASDILEPEDGINDFITLMEHTLETIYNTEKDDSLTIIDLEDDEISDTEEDVRVQKARTMHISSKDSEEDFSDFSDDDEAVEIAPPVTNAPKKSVEYKEQVFSENAYYQQLQQAYSEYTKDQKKSFKNDEIARTAHGHRTVQSPKKYVETQINYCFKFYKDNNLPPDFREIEKFTTECVMNYLNQANLDKNELIVNRFKAEITKQVKKAEEAQKKL